MTSESESKEEFLRGLLIEEINDETKPSEILSKIRYGAIESFSYEQNKATIIFFNYVDLYLTIKDIQKNNAFKVITPLIVPIKQNLKNAYLAGGTRCIKIEQEGFNFQFFKDSAESFGELEKIHKENNNIIIYFLSISSSLKFVKKFFAETKYRNKISFLTDPCSVEKYKKNDNFDESFYNQNRTIYIGGIQQDVTFKDLFDIIKGGDVISLKILRDKKCAFIDFLDFHSANAFLAYYSINECNIIKVGENNEEIIHKLKVSRGVEGKLHISVVLHCYSNATRAILVYNKDQNLDKHKLMEDFKAFGDIEHINYVKGKNLIFINFCSISDSYNAYNHFKNNDFYKIKHKMCYGRDRCSNETLDNIFEQILQIQGIDEKEIIHHSIF